MNKLPLKTFAITFFESQAISCSLAVATELLEQLHHQVDLTLGKGNWYVKRYSAYYAREDRKGEVILKAEVAERSWN